jgi:NADH dehydrogenase [ubiquinone] 1 alpha subcomplex assembly factor 7
MSGTPLARAIAQIIRDEGPMALDRYMALCLGHPEHGYYTARDPFGETGDFITAPEASQIFGELIGVWCISVYRALAAPPRINLIELGPGRGRLMRDIIRAARVAPDFGRAVEIHFVETSPALRRAQADAVPRATAWHSRLDTVPEGPLILIANEFFDALPIRQFEFREGRWRERCVGLTEDGKLALGLFETARPLGPAAEGSILEVSPEREGVGLHIGRRLASNPGVALIIDYGHLRSGLGDTLQAIRNHRACGILDFPGESDLTAHVDFEPLAGALSKRGAVVHRVMTQREFLLAMGLEARAAALSRNISGPDRDMIARAVERLAGPAQMGNLFKVVAATSPGLSAPYPFGIDDRGP